MDLWKVVHRFQLMKHVVVAVEDEMNMGHLS